MSGKLKEICRAKTSLIVFREIFRTLASRVISKSRKSHDIDMKFSPRKLDIKDQNCIRHFDKMFLFSSSEYFCRITHQKL